MTVRTAALALACAVAIGGCGTGYTRVREIKAAPDSFTGKEVRLQGTAASIAESPRPNAFLLRDGSGEIMVVTKGALPMEDAEVALKGIVRMTVTQGVRWTVDVRVDEMERLR